MKWCLLLSHKKCQCIKLSVKCNSGQKSSFGEVVIMSNLFHSFEQSTVCICGHVIKPSLYTSLSTFTQWFLVISFHNQNTYTMSSIGLNAQHQITTLIYIGHTQTVFCGENWSEISWKLLFKVLFRTKETLLVH